MPKAARTAMQQAEIEYKDFRTFFPNMPEAAEAQLKVANIHYQEMEKPDRDYTHAMRAEEEYRALIQEYPDSKLVPQAKQRLREVQEVLAEREFKIGRFYYPAAGVSSGDCATEDAGGPLSAYIAERTRPYTCWVNRTKARSM